VGKTLEQSLMEVLEEEELANMRAHQVSHLALSLFKETSGPIPALSFSF